MGERPVGDPREGRSGERKRRADDGLVESTTDHAIFELDGDGEIATWSAPATSLYGYAAEEALGKHLLSFFESPETLDRPVGVVLAQAAEGTVTVEATHERADGSTFWARTAISPLGTDAPGNRYAVVCEDRTGIRDYERQLERQNDRLKEFTDILVHDLRNPLHVIDQRLALFHETGDETHLESLEETTARMERLVEDLLRVARQGNLVSDPEPTDVEAVIRTAWEGAAAGQDEATLRYEPVPRLSADPDRLCELFENLFRNAVEHAGSDVTVVVGPMDDGFFVEDDGSGIPDDLRGEVFDHGVTTVADGTGYGLSVVRTIANAHGWDVVVADGAEGGARFEFTGVGTSA